MARQRKIQQGSVVLEALIAILIFSMGILALVGMQATAINSVTDAKYRSDANYLANQILGVIWANRVASGTVCSTGAAAAAAQATSAVVTGTAAGCFPDPAFACTSCNLATQGNAATRAWAGVSGVAGILPNGTASIAVAGNQVTVTLGWLPPNSPTGMAAHNHTVITNVE